MTASEIRNSFIDFYKNKGHTFVPSESLMPSSPNLLFTNAGMNQFVPYFLGDRPITFSRAVNSQKCIRAGGKHNDLEDVGFDTYHHTFFEMLGNWSFGDYFKKDSIEWAWELLTKVWGFPKERLYVTVYKPDAGDPDKFDQEAYDLWKSILEKEGLDPNQHIVNGNRKDNFWMMGDTGPCGPCSEIHVDLTEKGNTKGSLVNMSSPYCIEIWNLVFIQFNAEANGTFRHLTNKHVDTGLGLERVAGIIATTKNFTDFSGVPSNYNSDLFTDIFAKLEKLSGHMYRRTMPKDLNNMSKQERNDCSFRVLADHIRTLSFSIADGILPGNEGRNYVLRRILRRAILWGQHLELPEGFFAELIDCVINKMGDFFPELKTQRQLIHKVIESEEKSFERTLDRGLQLLDKIASKSKTISGQDAFTLYDTYGFPIDLTQLIAKEKHLNIDIEGFNKAMDEQREKARSAQKKSIISVSEDKNTKPATEFVGYNRENLSNYETTLIKIVNNEGKTYLVFDKTPFYATMGGQIGDLGQAFLNDSTQLKIIDTIKDELGHILHQVENNIKINDNLIGQKVKVSVFEDRRRHIERNHTATHLLHWALRKHLGTHVKQAGSLVDDKKLRFDFSHFQALSHKELEAIEYDVNHAILKNTPVQWYEVPYNEKPENCIAFFGEKYGSIVRVVDIGGYSVELCGGTHVNATGEIGLLKIVNETAIASGTRRIEAIAGQEAYNLLKEQSHALFKISNALSCKPNEIPSRVELLLDQKNILEKELRKLEQQNIAGQEDKLLQLVQEHNGLKWLITQVDIPNTNDLRGLAVNLSHKIGPSVIIFVSVLEDKIATLALCTPEAINKGYQAGKLVSDLTTQLGGKGGGKPDFAMGGAKNSGQVLEVLKNFQPYS